MHPISVHTAVTIFAILWSTEARDNVLTDGCATPAYLDIGEMGILHCRISADFHSIHWYPFEEIAGKDSVINYEQHQKNGPGFESGEFDIFPNGSLIINNVTIKTETIFTLVVLQLQLLQLPAYYRVNVEVRVKPTRSYPVIHQCNDRSELCIFRHDGHSDLVCSVEHTRPMVPLLWKMRRNREISASVSQDHTVHNETITHSSNVTLLAPSEYFTYSALFLCEANDPMNLLERTESSVLVLNNNLPIKEKTAITRVEYGKTLELACGDDTFIFVWKNSDTDQVLIYGIVNEEYVALQEGFDHGKKGSMVISSAMVHHEGTYVCVSNNGTAEDIRQYDTSVIIHPVPEFLFIEGCVPGHHCALETSGEGNLSCQVTGIRPEVSLEWDVPEYDTTITFVSQHLTVKENGDAFDIRLNSDYSISDATKNKITVECRTAGPNSDLNQMSTKIDLWINTGTPIPDESELELRFIILISISVVVIALCSVGSVIYYKVRSSNRDEERGTADEVTPMVYTNDGKRYIFLEELKSIYKKHYNSVHPIPYLREKLFSIQSLFVDSSLEVLEQGHWEAFGSYADMRSDPRLNSRRHIIEGGPGYGKSTLTLQLVYEWCEKVEGSFFENVDILIFIRLRQVNGVRSIYDVIKYALCKENDAIQSSDIRNILRQSPRVALVLDGFDEYIGCREYAPDDVTTIIREELFPDLPELDVLLTTRSSHIPASYPPSTKRVRLSGFNHESRVKYLQKVFKEEDADKIKWCLRNNPILELLCHIPLFFVMFAHLGQDNVKPEEFASATIFFSHVIACLHNHSGIKLESSRDPSNLMGAMFQETNFALINLASEITRKRRQWSRNDLCDRLGVPSLDRYLSLGILREEEVIYGGDPTEKTDVRPSLKVEFHHGLFQEWYAAHYLVTLLQNKKRLGDDELKLLDDLDKLEVQFMLRFACGLNKNAAEHIIQYLQDSEGFESLVILCKLEKEGAIGNVTQSIRNIFTKGIQINETNNGFLDRPMVQLMEIASIRKIPISRVVLNAAVSPVQASSLQIVLKSGIEIPLLHTLKELWIELNRSTVDPEGAQRLLGYAYTCEALRTVRFTKCVLPFSGILRFVKGSRKEITALWCPFRTWFRLNMQSGKWEFEDDGSELSESEYNAEVDSFNSVFMTDMDSKVQPSPTAAKDIILT